jgi:HlyD family secretion protein
MAKRIVPVVVILLLVGFFGYRAWQQRLAARAADRFNGTVEATEVLLSPQLSGQIVEKNVLEGQRVKKGDLLFRIDETLYQAQLEQAQAARQTAASQEAVVDANLAVLDQNLGRASRLYRVNAAPRAPVEDLGLQRRVLEAQREAVRSQLGQAEAAVNLVSKQKDYTLILAPVDGTAVRVHGELGEMVFPGTALATIADLTQVEIRVYVPEPMLGRIKLGQKAELYTDSFPDRPLPAVVSFISDQAEFTPKNVQTKDERVRLVYAVKLTAANGEGIFKIGMPVDARFGE